MPGYKQDVIIKKNESWKKEIKKWKKTQLSQSEYCRKYNLNVKVFGYWKRKLSRTEPLSDFKFAEIPIPQPFLESDVKTTIPNSTITLKIKSKYEIEINDNFNRLTLQNVLSVIEGV